MEIKEFKKIARILKQVYAELEMEALKRGVNLVSDEYELMMADARTAVLSRFGFTIEEYRLAKSQVEEERRSAMPKYEELKQQVDSIVVPTKEEIAQIAREVAQEFIVPPVVTNQIVKETTVEQPRILETVREITKVERVEYNDKPLKKEIARVEGKVNDIKIPPPIDTDELKEEMRNEFAENFKHNIDALGMPDFRKLGMGLQQQIDEKQALITFSTTAPTDNLYLNRLWVNLS